MTAINRVSKVFRWGFDRSALCRGHAELWPGSETPSIQCIELADFSEPTVLSVPPPMPASWRLERLLHAARTSRDLARNYLRAAKSMTAAIRGALAPTAPDLAEARLAALRDSQLRARKTLAFTALCRRRAARLAGEHDDAGK